jgi:hypothetical protein
MTYDFANLLFSGPCNARCPFCIGQQVITPEREQPGRVPAAQPGALDRTDLEA